MEQFLLIALAHFLALLSPGPDFFLVVRNAATSGWKVASGACLGIALANGVFITLAFAGLALLREGSLLFIALQLAGCAYLLYVGVLFVRQAGERPLLAPEADGARRRGWLNNLLAGFVCAILNPKNALFYASLASMVSGASPGWKLAYSAWMFSIVLLWDLLVAGLIGHRHIMQRFARALPALQRGSGAMLILLALGVLVHLAMG